MITPPSAPSTGVCGSRTHPPDRERLFKRRDEGYISGSRSRQLRRGKGSCSKERSSSMSRLLEGSVGILGIFFLQQLELEMHNMQFVIRNVFYKIEV